ncbi:MAG: monovalent cation/H+ antiporter complex subunit F [Archaeoglobales archaeon]|nr:monovalent cation/H+ antiporter complex subunit F [Archaeoglobales archaeon]
MILTFLAVGILLGLTITMCSYRLIFGPGVFNRIAAANAIGVKAMVLLVVVGYVIERPHFIDIALMYAILNFIGVVIAAKYLEKGEICS